MLGPLYDGKGDVVMGLKICKEAQEKPIVAICGG